MNQSPASSPPTGLANETWRKSILLTHGQKIFGRCLNYYAQLAALPRTTRRKLKVATGAGLATLALAMALSSAPTAHAATITVGGGCTLADAITAANTNTATGSCVAGSGADTIELTGDVILGGALPQVTSDITLNGNGHTVDANGGAFSIFYANGNSADLTITNATITGMLNPTGFASAVYAYNGATVTINNSTITGNTKNAGSASGAAVSAFGGNARVNINSSTISNNNGNRGAILIEDTATLNMTNSTVSGNDNTGNTEGGGVHVQNGATAIITNSTITGNDTNEDQVGYGGGGIFVHPDGNLTLTRSIVSGNTNSGSGAAVEIDAPPGAGTRTFTDNVLGDSGETNAGAFYGVPLAGNITATSNGTNPTALASILATTLTNNGGATPTHDLTASSPAVDAAPSADCEGGVITGIDQRGAARNIDGDSSSSSNECDIGALEFNSSEIPTEIGTAGECTGADLSGVQTFDLGGAIVSIDVTNANGLKCISVGQFASNHPNATGSPGNPGIATGQWWRINGNINSGFTVNMTLPFAGADTDSRVCEWLDGAGPGFGWNCAADSFVANTSVTRNGINSFSDWAVGDEVGPTAVTNLQSQTQTEAPTGGIAALVSAIALALGTAWAAVRRRTS